MLLKNLMKKTFPSPFTMIKDNCMVSSGHLLKEYVLLYLNSNCAVRLFSFEDKLRHLLDTFEGQDKFYLHNLFPTAVCSLDDSIFRREILKLFEDSPPQPVLVIIDSINTFLRVFGMKKFTTLVQKAQVKNKDGQLAFNIIGVAHWDDEAISETAVGLQLERLASSLLTLSCSPNENPKVSILHKKPSGRHLNEVCEWWLAGGKLELKEVSKEKPKDVAAVVDAEIPRSFTTFRIELDDQEKASRDNLVLPYMKHLKGGNIHYEPDENDDWDDEDPDDDLDI